MTLTGVTHKIAWVDLGSAEVRYETPPDSLYETYLGGYGLGAYYLYNRQRAGVDPVGSEATLGFTTGPLTGTPAITGSRFTVVGKSPKTGGWGDANCGGKFGPALKQAGLDAVFVTGIAERPVYLLVEDGQVHVRDASALSGRVVSETERMLRSEHGRRAQAAVIGPAGEAVRALAAIMTDDHRAAGRSGLGMVMGSKRLKAVVAVGTGKVTVADEPEFKALRKRLVAEYCHADNPSWVDWHEYGTAASTLYLIQVGDTPVRNYGAPNTAYPDADKVSGDAVKALVTKPYACWACPIACGAYVRVEDGPYAGEASKPEYETIGSFGPMCLNDNLESICRLNTICNEYGVDTMSTGVTLAFALECYEHGLISKDDLDGVELIWGDHAALVAVTEQIVRGHGFAGRVFGDGVRKAAQVLGPDSLPFAMECGGEELSMHDARCFPGIAASSVADATPGRHTQGGSWFPESAWVPVDAGVEEFDKYTYSGKGEMAKHFSNLYHTVNMAGLCQFSPLIIPAAEIPRYLTLAMGREFSMDDVLTIGERAANLRIAFNLREGVRNIEAYRMPARALGRPPLTDGPTANVTLDNETQLRDYYSAMGWDPDTGVPTAEALERLGLDFAVSSTRGG